MDNFTSGSNEAPIPSLVMYLNEYVLRFWSKLVIFMYRKPLSENEEQKMWKNASSLKHRKSENYITKLHHIRWSYNGKHPHTPSCANWASWRHAVVYRWLAIHIIIIEMYVCIEYVYAVRGMCFNDDGHTHVCFLHTNTCIGMCNVNEETAVKTWYEGKVGGGAMLVELAHIASYTRCVSLLLLRDDL